MKNVLVFALAGGRYAVELRWVREILALGHLTPIPTAPAVIAGATNFRGAIVPVLGGAALAGGNVPAPPERPRAPRAGDAMILVDVEGTRAAIAADRIDEVTTLVPSADLPDTLIDGKGRPVPLVDPPALLAFARAQIADAAGGRGP